MRGLVKAATTVFLALVLTATVIGVADAGSGRSASERGHGLSPGVMRPAYELNAQGGKFFNGFGQFFDYDRFFDYLFSYYKFFPYFID